MTGSTAVRQGYTFDDLDHMTRTAVLRDYSPAIWWTSNMDDRYNLAWCAIAEHLAFAEETPARQELIQVGAAALTRSVNSIRRDYGLRDNARAFNVYWLDLGMPSGSPERAIVERAALSQIWPLLTRRHREVFEALATFDNHTLAAQSLGMEQRVFSKTLSNARRQFLGLWHEGEEPSRPWGNDRRRKEGSRRPTATAHLSYQKKRTKVEPVHGKASTYRNHRCRCPLCKESIRLEEQQRRAKKRALAAVERAT